VIHYDQTKLIQGKTQRTTYVWVTCDFCGTGRWIIPSTAKRLSEGQPCRSCSNKHSWEGRRIDLTDGYRRCSMCGRYKPLSQFARDRRKRGGVRSYCLACSAKKAREYRKQYKERARRSHRVAQAKRRAEKRHAGGAFTATDWLHVLDRYGHQCVCCGATEDLQIDHIVPLSKGGAHNIDNIQPLCGFCNRHKSTAIIDYR